MRRPFPFCAFLFLLLSGVVYGQSADSSRSPAGSGNDTTQGRISGRDYYAIRPLDTSRSQNPTAALFKSMLVPGWGQIGNGKYVKAAMVIGGEAYFLSRILHFGKITRDKKKAFQAADAGSTDRYDLFQEYQSAKDDRNLNSWFLGTCIFISMFDAYVDAHLAHFPEYDRTFAISLEPLENAPIGARLSFRF
ncbi:exported hypothetical protein [Candidatus Zixiibacteriota bacterium]|nr:exported hypothetical protein [candidate division Zixibacteria bacterium]